MLLAAFLHVCLLVYLFNMKLMLLLYFLFITEPIVENVIFFVQKTLSMLLKDEKFE